MSFIINPFVFASDELSEVFSWDPENGDALPGTATFTRGSAAWYRNDSGVWVETLTNVIRDGHNKTPGGGVKGYISEPAATKLSLHKRDLSDAVWSATDITPVRDATGIDGVGSSASTLTSTAANGTIFQSFTLSSAVHTHQAFVARKTGTGTIEMTIDGGTTWVDITSSLTSSIDNPFVVTQTLANPSIGFRIVTSGDEIEVDCSELETNAGYPTTPIVEESASTTSRSADLLVFSTISAAPYGAFADVTYPSELLVGGGENVSIFQFGATTTNKLAVSNVRQLFLGGSPVTQINVVGGTPDDREKLAVRIATDDMALSITGETTGTDTNAAVITGDISIGKADRHFRGVIHNVKIYDEGPTDPQLEALVA